MIELGFVSKKLINFGHGFVVKFGYSVMGFKKNQTKNKKVKFDWYNALKESSYAGLAASFISLDNDVTDMYASVCAFAIIEAYKLLKKIVKNKGWIK